MKKIILRLFVFLIPVIIVIGLWEYGLSKITNSYSLKRDQLEAQASKIEVLVLGNSQALWGINPDFFTSNVGYNVANVDQSLFYDTRITLNYLDKMTSLKVVLIDISYHSLWYQIHDGKGSFRDYFYADYWGIKYPAIKWYDIRQYSKILQYGNNIAWSYALKGFNIDLVHNYQSNGWGSLEIKRPITNSAADTMVKNQEMGMKQENFYTNVNDLIYLLKELNKRKIKAVFFVPPFSETYCKYINKNRLKEIDSTLSSLCAMYNCKWYDFKYDKRFSNEDFKDVGHLNRYGAAKFSKIINDEILKNSDSTHLKY